jgi:hypothetical protein
LCRQTSARRLIKGGPSLREDHMIQYVQTMARKEPITLLVAILMIAILIFGLWDVLHVVKRH